MDDLEKRARVRVNNSKVLSKHKRVLFYDWADWNDHMQWIIVSSEAEIVAWAKGIEQDEKDNEPDVD